MQTSRGGTHGRVRRVVVATVVVALATLATSCVDKVEVVQGGSTNSGSGRPTGSTGPNDTSGSADSAAAQANVIGGQNAGGAPIVSEFAGQKMSFGSLPTVPKEATGEPIKIGMINQENTPLGSFPEIRLGAEAAVKFVNTELNGVGGRPLELESCITTFSVEKSRSCAQEMVEKQVVAVVGGIDITSMGSIPVLEQNQIPYVGGIPINFDEMRSPISFQFSGGVPGAFAAFSYDAATRLHAKKVAVTYADYASIKAAGVDDGVAILKKLGVPDVVDIPFPITTTDFLPVLTKANEGNPDAIFLGAADTACAPAMKIAAELHITAKIYLVGSCAAPNIPDQIGEAAVDGRLFNIEGPKGSDDLEAKLYFDAVAKYGDPQLPAASAATISFRSLMNLYGVMSELGPDHLSKESIIAQFRQAKDHPSFTGHSYTCDGKQIPDLPAMCAPQQIIVERRDKSLVAVTDWIDVSSLVTK